MQEVFCMKKILMRIFRRNKPKIVMYDDLDAWLDMLEKELNG